MYCSVEDIARYLSPHKDYSGKIYDKIEIFIKEISIDIDSLLTSLGVKLPIPSSENRFLDFIKYWATIGASAKTELSLHGPNEDPRVMGYGQMLWQMYDHWKRMMLQGMYDIKGMLNNPDKILTDKYKRQFERVIWYSLLDSDHDVKTIFKRDEDQW